MSDVCMAPDTIGGEGGFDAVKDKTMPHRLPRYLRLSGLAGTREARVVLMGACLESKYDNSNGCLMSPYDYAYENNLNKNMVYMVVTSYLPHRGKKSARQYTEAQIKAVLLKYGPPEGTIDAEGAGYICRNFPKPKPVWQIGCAKYYDPAECKKQHEQCLKFCAKKA